MNPSNRRRRCTFAAAALSLALLAGCSTVGLSPRETPQQNYSSYVYSLYDLTPSAGIEGSVAADVTRAQPKLSIPARLAVVQVGEVAPPKAFLDKLRARPDLFPRVEGISGITGSYEGPADAGVGRAHAGQRGHGDIVRRDVARMRRLARDMGMNHLLVVGGTIDHATHGNALSILDLTILGAFVIPSKQIDARATAAGAMIDLASGRVVLTASADATKGGVAATATQAGGQLHVLRQARDEVVAKLADSLVAECQRRHEAALVAGAS